MQNCYTVKGIVLLIVNTANDNEVWLDDQAS